MDNQQRFEDNTGFDDADMEYVANRIDPAFWDREDFLRKLKIIINDRMAAKRLIKNKEVERNITKKEFIALIKAIPTGNDGSKVDYYYDAIDKIDDAYLRGYLNAKTEALNKSLSSDSQDYKDEFLAIINDMCFL